jgi:ABC-type polar amino acid transport system ATPase subunit
VKRPVLKIDDPMAAEAVRSGVRIGLPCTATITVGPSTALLRSHEMGFARKVADKVVFVDMGRIVEDCTKTEFFTTRRSKRAQSFLEKIIH